MKRNISVAIIFCTHWFFDFHHLQGDVFKPETLLYILYYCYYYYDIDYIILHVMLFFGHAMRLTLS